jgi:hypothetical protein
VAVDNAWICHKDAYQSFLLTAIYEDAFLTHRGALLSYDWLNGELTAHAGTARVTIYAGGDIDQSFKEGLARHIEVLDDLYGVHETAPAGDLPRAVIPKQALRQVRKLVAAYRRLGSFRKVERKLGDSRYPSRYQVRNALVLAKVLRKHGPVDKTRCPDVPKGLLTSGSTRGQSATDDMGSRLGRFWEVATSMATNPNR